MTLRILFLVNVDWFFLSHRLPIALAAKESGAEVWVAGADTGNAHIFKEHGLHFIEVPFSRRGMNPLQELAVLPKLYRVIKSVRPDLVHQITIKPILFGSFVASLQKELKIVNAITGLGFTFSKDEKAGWLKRFILKAYRHALHRPNQQTIFQNPDDQEQFIGGGLVPAAQSVLIRGSGVDCKLFMPGAEDPDENIVLLASRMIWDKGIREFVRAAEIVKKRFPDVRFLLAGMSDDGNPNAVPESLLTSWTEEGNVEWLGHLENMPELLQRATVVALPTYYPEGVPKILIEAAASGKPIITTNRPGCREIVSHDQNGLLIDPRNADQLAAAIIQLLESPERRFRYGKAGRKRAVEEFSEEIVVRETMKLYHQMLGADWPVSATSTEMNSEIVQ